MSPQLAPVSCFLLVSFTSIVFDIFFFPSSFMFLRFSELLPSLLDNDYFDLYFRIPIMNFGVSNVSYFFGLSHLFSLAFFRSTHCVGEVRS